MFEALKKKERKEKKSGEGKGLVSEKLEFKSQFCYLLVVISLDLNLIIYKVKHCIRLNHMKLLIFDLFCSTTYLLGLL